jgi:ribonuclease R
MLPREQILKLIRERVPHPANTRELMRVLKIPREERPAFRRHITALVEGGELIKIRGNRYGVADKMDLIVGRVQTHPTGYGFVVPDRPIEDVAGDIYIAAVNLKEAMHGDRVVVRIERHGADQRAEGRIIRILERANALVVGRFDLDEAGLGFVLPFERRLVTDVHIPSSETGGATAGDMVTAEIVRWPTPTRGPVGRVVEVLGDVDAPGVDVQIIIRKYGIPDEHGPDAVEEARHISRESGLQEDHSVSLRRVDLEGRTDFRDIATVTIDGEHARDFDDAISIESLPNGHYRLGVHIADVSHYVREGSALDTEAYERGTSVYFAERAVHMFPSELATGLCSLNPQVDRLVQTCLMEVDRRGDVVQYEFHDGVIRTRERMTYTAVNAILTDRDPKTMRRYHDLLPMFEQMRELFEILHARRRRRGSIDFDLSETEVVLDEEGLIEAIIAAERNVAHRLIEEFMLLANETVAAYIEEAGGSGMFRVHEAPDPLKVEQFEEFISGFGYGLGAPPNALRPRHFQRLLERIAGKPEERPIAMLMLRSMQKARYAPVNLGHFGLAATSYTHFTSPIRRYPDLIVHRLLRELRRGAVDAERREDLDDELPDVARHSSEMERRAEDAERELLQWKKVRFMADKVGDEFEGYIIGVAAFGLFVELIEHFVEGLVHVSTMADDYYRFLDRTHTLRGENTHKVYRLGDRVRVQVIRVDMERRQVDLGLTDILETVRREEARRAAPKSKVRPKAERRRTQRRGKRERDAKRKR